MEGIMHSDCTPIPYYSTQNKVIGPVLNFTKCGILKFLIPFKTGCPEQF
jgi:hypothetical protein